MHLFAFRRQGVEVLFLAAWVEAGEVVFGSPHSLFKCLTTVLFARWGEWLGLRGSARGTPPALQFCRVGCAAGRAKPEAPKRGAAY